MLNTSPARHTETLSQRNKKVNPSRTLSTIWTPLSLELDANFRKAKPVIFPIADENRFGVYLWGAWFLGTLCTMWNNLQELLRKARQATAVWVTHLAQPVWWGWGRNTPTQVYIWLRPGRLFCSGYTWLNSCLLLWPFKTQNGSQVAED